jgi:hypothetical protein
MNKLTTWREHDYFKEREDHYFLFETINPILKVAKLIKFKGSYYFDYTGMQIKAITTPCVSLNDINGLPVHYKGHPKIRGIVGGYGVVQTPFIYIFWGRVAMRDDDGNQQGFPCALPDNYNIISE